MYDLIIIGLGPAGLSAAIYAARSNLKVLSIEKETPGGKLNTIKDVQNYLGYENIMGPQLALIFYKQYKTLKIPTVLEEVQEIKLDGNIKKVFTHKNTYEAKAVIIATGHGQKKLKGYENLAGISYCTLCDANLYKDKDVALYGNNIKAAEEVLYLSDIAKNVYFINDKEINVPKNIREKLNKNNIKIYENEEITNIDQEDNKIKSINLKNEIINVQGLFVNIGAGPSTHFCTNLNILDKSGYILINEKQETDIPGIYAAGDSIKKDIYQIINAASEGATSAINANKYIKMIYKNK